jgi:hypothetical protein
LELMLNGFQVLNGIIEICFLFYYRYCVWIWLLIYGILFVCLFV